MDANKEEFYVQELKSALEDFREIEKEASKVADEKRKRTKLVKSLVSVLTHNIGPKEMRELLDKQELLEQAQPFLDPEYEPRPLAGTVVRRRKGKKKIVDPENVLSKGTLVRMTAGKYMGYTGIINSAQTRKTARGLDVTYFLTLSRGRSKPKRTSVKHGTIGKSWEVIQ